MAEIDLLVNYPKSKEILNKSKSKNPSDVAIVESLERIF